jgi:hypothetical protein
MSVMDVETTRFTEWWKLWAHIDENFDLIQTWIKEEHQRVAEKKSTSMPAVLAGLRSLVDNSDEIRLLQVEFSFGKDWFSPLVELCVNAQGLSVVEFARKGHLKTLGGLVNIWRSRNPQPPQTVITIGADGTRKKEKKIIYATFKTWVSSLFACFQAW